MLKKQQQQQRPTSHSPCSNKYIDLPHFPITNLKKTCGLLTPLKLALALNALPTTGAVEVSAEAEDGARAWAVTFLDNVGDVPLLEPAEVMLRSATGQGLSLAAAELHPGTPPYFDQGTVGIYAMPLGSAVLPLAPEVQTITVRSPVAGSTLFAWRSPSFWAMMAELGLRAEIARENEQAWACACKRENIKREREKRRGDR